MLRTLQMLLSQHLSLSLSQKIAFMVALGLVTTEHLEGEFTLAVLWEQLNLDLT